MARRLARGEVWTYRFRQPDKRRPVVVLSRADAIEMLRTMLVAPVTSTIHGVAKMRAVCRALAIATGCSDG